MTDAELAEVADAIAVAVASRLEGRLPVGLVDAETVADYLGVERSWVYDHAAELGARRLGEGPRARLRFSLPEVDERLASCSSSRQSEPAALPVAEPSRRRRRAAGLGTSVPLLPVRGSRGRSDGR